MFEGSLKFVLMKKKFQRWSEAGTCDWLTDDGGGDITTVNEMWRMTEWNKVCPYKKCEIK